MGMTTGKTEWIRELEGLRAVAILLVLLFHSQIDAFGGGGVGVDIFFVISGFIITLKLLEAHDLGGIDLIRFWQNRFARLIPAMLAVVFIVLLASPVFFSGSGLERIFLAATASLIYISNFFFMAEAGYFDASSLTKPMLHTWSLSVEEQFYLFWPIFIVALFRTPRRFWPIGLAGLGAASLIFAFWAETINSSIAFYMMPARIYQFCAGAIIATLLINFRGATGSVIFVTSLVSLVAIAIFVNPQSDGLFLSHVVPTMLTAAVISAIRSSAASRVLATRPTMYLGKISYSTYLIHWPVMVFYFNQDAVDLGAFASASLIVASIVAGYVLHVLIENPFRFTSKTTEQRRRNALWVTATIMALIIGATALIMPSLRPEVMTAPASVMQSNTESRLQNAAFVDPAPFRRHMQQRAMYGECSFGYEGIYKVEPLKLKECLRPVTGKTNVAVIGSSVSDAAFVALLDTLEEGEFHIAKAGLAGCDPHLAAETISMSREAFKRACDDFNRQRLALALQNEFDIIVLVAQWLRTELDDIRNLVDYIKEGGAFPVIVGSSPSFREDIVASLGRMPVQDRLDANFYSVLAKPNLPRRNGEMRELARSLSVPFVNLLDYSCRPEDCSAFDEDGRLLYFDRVHMTQAGADGIAPIVSAAVYEAAMISRVDTQ